MAASMIGWSFLYMLNAAMRLVGPSFAFGLSFASFSDGSEKKRLHVSKIRIPRARFRFYRSVAGRGALPPSQVKPSAIEAAAE
jgi:hypothetical protein